jgi:hypothetical protein
MHMKWICTKCNTRCKMMDIKQLKNQNVELRQRKTNKIITSGIVKNVVYNDKNEAYLELKNHKKTYLIKNILIQYLIL